MIQANTNLTPVEKKVLAESSSAPDYQPFEKISTLVVSNFPALGKLAAMRFIEWAQQNPGGTISLPTGKTPEHFISWVSRILNTWDSRDTQNELEQSGIESARNKPDMTSLNFVQIDEFYPMDSAQHNSFHYYVKRFYVKGFGMDPAKCLLMDGGRICLKETQRLGDVWPDGSCDLSLRTRRPRTLQEGLQKEAIERVDQWCQQYEERVRALGGIGFFLGGIGPDGHIGFNVRGSDHHSTTRLTETNYETQAASATDLGGIEVSRKRLVITIGLGTITFNPQATALIVAAGEAKAAIVAGSIQSEPSVIYPATCLQKLPNARFYLTQGAAKLLEERRFLALASLPAVSNEAVEQALVDAAVHAHKRIMDLSADDIRRDRFASETLRKRDGSASTALKMVHARLIRKIEDGARVRTQTRFLHTEPHHDDIMLGYLPAVVRNIRDASNEHFFATLTSGFTAITNGFAHERLLRVCEFLDTPRCEALMESGHFKPGNQRARNSDIWRYLDGVAADNPDMKQEAEVCRDLCNLAELFQEPDGERASCPSVTAREEKGGRDAHPPFRLKLKDLMQCVELAYPGQKDPDILQRFKGMFREWEAETLWGYFGWQPERVFHLRLGFYSGDIFTEEPTMERDVPPVVALLQKTNPHIVTVALDPEASGPDTHYKVMQATAAALNVYAENQKCGDLKIWGYRNVWFRFQPAEANHFVPVSLNMLAVMEASFLSAFASQKKASFPSYEHDGPFCDLARKIQISQYAAIRTCLGEEWFYEHSSPLIRATRGLVYLKEMRLDEFNKFCRDLRRTAENR